jgi:hypothetical protein
MNINLVPFGVRHFETRWQPVTCHFVSKPPESATKSRYILDRSDEIQIIVLPRLTLKECVDAPAAVDPDLDAVRAQSVENLDRPMATHLCRWFPTASPTSRHLRSVFRADRHLHIARFCLYQPDSAYSPAGTRGPRFKSAHPDYVARRTLRVRWPTSGPKQCGGVEVADLIDDCGERLRVVTVKPPPAEAGFGRAWAERIPGSDVEPDARDEIGVPAMPAAHDPT